MARATWPPVHLPAANSARPCSGPSSWVPAQHDLQLWRRKSPSITKRPYERHGWDAKERSRRHLATDVVGRIVAGVLVAGPADTMGRLCPSCTFTLVGRQPGELGHYHDHIRYGRYRRNIFPRLPKLSRANQCRLQQSVEKRVFRVYLQQIGLDSNDRFWETLPLSWLLYRVNRHHVPSCLELRGDDPAEPLALDWNHSCLPGTFRLRQLRPSWRTISR